MFVIAVIPGQRLSVHAAGAKSSPWLSAVSPTLPSQLIGLLSKDGADHAVDTWCWQALYLLQAQLSASQMDQILQHPAAQRVSIMPVLHCSRSRFCSSRAARLQGMPRSEPMPRSAVLCCAVLCCAVPHCAVPHCAVPHCAMLCCAVMCLTLLHSTALLMQLSGDIAGSTI